MAATTLLLYSAFMGSKARAKESENKKKKIFFVVGKPSRKQYPFFGVYTFFYLPAFPQNSLVLFIFAQVVTYRCAVLPETGNRHRIVRKIVLVVGGIVLFTFTQVVEKFSLTHTNISHLKKLQNDNRKHIKSIWGIVVNRSTAEHLNSISILCSFCMRFSCSFLFPFNFSLSPSPHQCCQKWILCAFPCPFFSPFYLVVIVIYI